MLTILVNKCVTLIVIGAGLLQALWMLTGDFVTMARAADRARPSPYPLAWRVRNLTLSAVSLAMDTVKRAVFARLRID